MPRVNKGSERRSDVLPTLVALDLAADQISDEGAPSPRTDAPVDFRHQFVIQSYV